MTLKKQMRICIDIDGTICETRSKDQHYLDVQPIKHAIESIQELSNNGHYIILYTARHMKTCNHNVGQVVAKQGKNLFDWLEKHSIPYDEIIFGKPLADVYIDDKGIKFNNNWNEIMETLNV